MIRGIVRNIRGNRVATSSRRWPVLIVMPVVAVASLFGTTPLAHAQQTFNVVTNCGADPTGVKDSTLAVQMCIADAQSAGPGNTVEFPAGTYSFFKQISGGSSLVETGSNWVSFLGDGSTPPVLNEDVGKNLLDVQVDGTVINNLAFDAQPNSMTSSAQSALVMAASNTLLENSTILGGPNTYALYYPGPSGASRTNLIYDTGNVVDNVTASDEWNRDGISFSYQDNGMIEYLNHTGSRLGLYVDENTSVDNDTYHPGAQTASTQGFWITAPSENITINNFTTYGNGGTIGSGGQPSTNIAINNETFENPGFHLAVGEVDGLTISGCDFGTNSELNFITEYAATSVVVENCTSLPVVRFVQTKSHAGTVSAEFTNDTYPAFTPTSGEGSQTFLDAFDGPTDFTVNQGTFENCAGGFFHGTNTTFEVNGLSGYPCSPDSPPNAALNVTPSSGVAPLNVEADASGSTANQEPIVDYQFTWGDGTESARQPSATMSHVFSTPGTYTVMVDVIDKDGLHSTASETVTANVDEPPVAALTVTPTSGNVPLNVEADASASSDPDGTTIASYTFDFGDGTVVGPQTGATATHTYNLGGTFTVTVTVTDIAGYQSQATEDVTASYQNIVGNPGFESGTTGWRAGAGAVLSRSTTAHSGSYSAQITRSASTGRALLMDSPPWNSDTTAGTTCYFSAWVQAPVTKVYLRTIELNGTATVSTNSSSVKTAGATWVLLTGTAPIINAGDALRLTIYAPLALGQALLVDDVSEACH